MERVAGAPSFPPRQQSLDYVSWPFWEGFQTEEEAEAQGERLKRSGETYVIEERDGDCPVCKAPKEPDERRISRSLPKNPED